MKRNPMIILSLDGLASKDLEYIEKLPHFKAYMDSASGSKHVKSIYPSVTYAAHATIVTGCYPKTHGIVDNTYLEPHRESPDWYWQHGAIQSKTLYDLAKERGYKVAALLWPTTARASIQINMPEIFANRFYHHQIMVSLRNGTMGFQFKMNQKYGKLRKGKKQPYLDHFTQKALLEVIREEHADLILCHFTDLDSMRHENSFESEASMEALRRHDERLGEIMAALQEDDFYRDATVVILGDHASKDVTKVLSPNAFLKALGWVKYGRGNHCTYEAISKSCDGSAYIYGQNLAPDRVAVLKGNLEQFMAYTQGVERILESEDIIGAGADPKALFMLEAKEGYVFEDTHDVPYVMALEEHPAFEGQKISAVHGYSPDKEGYDTVFMLSGPEVAPGVWIEDMALVDIAPTLAPLLGVSMPQVEGQMRQEFLRDEENA